MLSAAPESPWPSVALLICVPIVVINLTVLIVGIVRWLRLRRLQGAGMDFTDG